MKIYVVGSSKDKFLPLDNIREKFLVDVHHDEDNIDYLNSSYCEATGLYHLWRNCNDDIVGLEHYRRYFINDNDELLSETDINNILATNDIIMYKYKNTTAYHCMLYSGKIDELNLALSIIAKKYGKDMADYFADNLIAKGAYEGNMFVCKKELINTYCKWLFDLLTIFDFLDNKKQQRIGGYIAEYMFGPWMKYNNKKIYDCKRQTYNKELTEKLYGHV